MPRLPSGTVTFLFADIEGSTLLLQRLGDQYAGMLESYRRLLRAAIKEVWGHEVSNEGDGFFVAFHRGRDALSAAVAAQRAITTHKWPEGNALRVRMGIHTGEPILAGREYVGIDVHRASRICDVAHGGQILVSQTTQQLIAGELPKGLSLKDLGAHRLKDLATERLFQVIAESLPADFPALKSLDALPNNLPRQLTNFIGREREIAEIKQVLSTAPLVTLVGAGGSEKTRLALQVAADVLADYQDGVWLVELAHLSDPALVAKTAALVLHVREDPGRPLIATLTEFACPRQLLLVMDNCEHLLAACAEFAEALLSACPGLRILATSREPLGILGERLWEVPPLSLPDHRYPPSPDGVMQSEAARLFADRATLREPQFAVTAANAKAISGICTRLEGIPLAIELAAARVPVMAPEEIADRLNDRFRLLVGGSRTALPRHQTLRATMDWSHELLSKEEKILLRRLSVFSNGWTLEAAEAIGSGDPIRSNQVLDLLSQLVRKSLVRAETGGAEARHRQLETVREYGGERLLESGEAPDVRNRHRDWYAGLAERAAPELIGERQAAWLHRLAAEHDNLRTALGWSIERGDVEAGLRLAAPIWQYWLARGHIAEGRRWLETLLKVSEGVAPPVRAQALFAAGNLAVHGQGDYVPGRLFYEESLTLWREIGDKRRIADLLNGVGVLAGAVGDQGSARARHEESLAIRRELGDQWGIGVSLHNLGRVAYREGGYETARTLFAESLALWRNTGDTRRVAMALNNLGFAATRLAEYRAAQACLVEALEILQKLGDKRQIGDSLEAFSCLAAAAGQPRQAARLFGAAEALRETISVRVPPADRPDFDHWIQVARTALGREIFEQAFAEGRTLGMQDALAEAQMLWGQARTPGF